MASRWSFILLLSAVQYIYNDYTPTILRLLPLNSPTDTYQETAMKLNCFRFLN